MNNFAIILSLIPFLIFLFLLFIKKSSLLKTSVVTLVSYTILAVFYWKILPLYLVNSYLKGFFVAIDIFIIIFGAIFFLQILKDLKIIKNISYYLSGISKDYRVQIIIIAWFFECFLEGTAGFGTPAAIAVPLLIGLGLPPIKALVVGLLGNSIPGIFGAAGTPIKVGFAGLSTMSVPFYASILNLVGFIVPIFMLWIITEGRTNRKKEFLDALPFSILSGFLFVIPSALVVFLGQEFPSILGSIIGLVLIILFIKLKVFIPSESLILQEEKETAHTMSAFKAFLPYGVLVIFLILGKIILGKIGIPLDMSTIGLKHTFNFFNPGLIFIITGLIIAFAWKSQKKIFYDSVKLAFSGAVKPFFVIASMLAMVQIMINSGNNLSGLSSAISFIAHAVETNLLPFFAPFAGAFGAFMTGSVTVSNVMFGALFNTASINLGFNPEMILSLLVVGAGAGNMIALADILTAEAVIGEKNAERKILKGVLIPCFTFLFIVGIIGLLIF